VRQRIVVGTPGGLREVSRRQCASQPKRVVKRCLRGARDQRERREATDMYSVIENGRRRGGWRQAPEGRQAKDEGINGASASRKMMVWSGEYMVQRCVKRRQRRTRCVRDCDGRPRPAAFFFSASPRKGCQVVHMQRVACGVCVSGGYAGV